MKIKTLLLVPSFLICLGCHSQSTSLNPTPTPLKIEKKADYAKVQPYYQLDFSAAFCLFEVRVNDVLVFTMNLDGQTSTMIPINSAILESGKQQIAIKVLPLAGQKLLHPSAQFKYNIKVFDAANDLNFKEQVPGEYAVAKVDPAKKQTVLTQTASFNAAVPYTVTAYQHGTDLASVKGLKDKMHDAYQQLSGLIKKADVEQIKKLIANRENFAAVTMYLNKEEADDRMSGIVSNLKSGFKLQPIPADAVVKIFGNGKLATLIRPNGEPALILKNEKDHEELQLEFSFFIPAGKADLEII